MRSKNHIILIHTSDFHVRPNESDVLSRAHDIRQLMVFDAEQLSELVGSPDAIVFSGDIASSGKEAEYDVARELFSKMLSKLGLDKQCVLVVPGNHDVNRPLAETLDARMLRDFIRASSEVKAEELFAEKRTELLSPISAFQEFAIPYDCLIQGEMGFWEITNKEGSSAAGYLDSSFEIVIRGISTVHVSDRNDDKMKDQDIHDPTDFGSHMYVAHGQLACDPATKDSPLRILVGHHPPIWWRFCESRRNLANARFHLQLFGHEHNFAPSPSGHSVCVKAGAVNPDELGNNPRYNWIKISEAGDKYALEIWSRVYDTDTHQFTEDPNWPGGQGYQIYKDLKFPPELIGPLAARPEDKSSMEEDDCGVSSALAVSPAVEKEASPPSPREIRYVLLSQNPKKYSQIFARLGYIPDQKQMRVLGGLEFYEESLESLLLPENISELVRVMKEEGLYGD